MTYDPLAWLDIGPSIRETKRELSSLEMPVTHRAPLVADRYSQAEWDLFFTGIDPVTKPCRDWYESWPEDRHVLVLQDSDESGWLRPRVKR